MISKKIRRLTAILIASIFMMTNTVYASSAGAIQIYWKKYELMAAFLQDMHVLRGGDKGFELERQPTRLEGAVMLVRLLGMEKEAVEKDYAHPFKDVPEWGSPYVGYLYKMKLTKGQTADHFGSNDKMTSLQYLTFVLRALGYSEEKGDFEWNKSDIFAYNLGIIDYVELDRMRKEEFKRDSMVFISFNALCADLKGEDRQLSAKLIDEGVINEAIAKDRGVYDTERLSGTGILLSDIKEGEPYRLVGDDIKAMLQLSPSDPGSVLSCDYDGGRYIVFEHMSTTDTDNVIRLYDLEKGKVSGIIDRDAFNPKIKGDTIVYRKQDMDNEFNITDNYIVMYNTVSHERKYIKVEGSDLSAYNFSEDGRYVSFTAISRLDINNTKRYLYKISDDNMEVISPDGVNATEHDYETSWAGHYLIYQGSENGYGHCYLYDVNTGNTRIFDYFPAEWIKGYGDWIVYEDTSVYLMNIESGEKRTILEEPPIIGKSFVGTVFKPVIQGHSVVWHNRGDFYKYDIETGNISRLTNYPYRKSTSFDERHYNKYAVIKDNIAIFYGHETPFEIMRIKSSK